MRIFAPRLCLIEVHIRCSKSANRPSRRLALSFGFQGFTLFRIVRVGTRLRWGSTSNRGRGITFSQVVLGLGRQKVDSCMLVLDVLDLVDVGNVVI